MKYKIGIIKGSKLLDFVIINTSEKHWDSIGNKHSIAEEIFEIIEDEENNN